MDNRGLPTTLAAAGIGAYMASQNNNQRPPYPNQQGGGPPYPNQGGYPNQGPPQAAYGQGGYGGQYDYMGMLQQAMTFKRLNVSDFPKLNLHALANACPRLIDEIMVEWKIPQHDGQLRNLMNDLVVLGLYDTYIFADNSGSMRMVEDGARIRQLAETLDRIAIAATKFDEDGVSLRFMNKKYVSVGDDQLNNIKHPQQIERLLGRNGQGGAVQFSGTTPLGSQLWEQILEKEIIPKFRGRRLGKPVLVIVLTDGEPQGETRMTFQKAITRTVEAAQESYGGSVPVAFQIAQIGSDEGARRFLGSLDQDKTIGPYVDATSNFEMEEQEQQEATGGRQMFRHEWLLKLLLGAIHPKHDAIDEAYKRGGAQPPQQSSYGQQQSYGQPAYQQAGGYGAPQGQGYGAPINQQYPPSGQAYGQAPSQYPPGQSYGGPQQYSAPGQQQYPPQQGQYGGQSQYSQQVPAQHAHSGSYGGPQQPTQQPPYGGYGQHQQQGGYGGQQQYPPQGQQGGYPPQQGGYGQPPYPPQGQQGGYPQGGAPPPPRW